MITVIP
jgi:hypothetical protein